MLAHEKPETDKQLLELLDEMSALCRRYEMILQNIVHDNKKEQEDRKNRQLQGIAIARAHGVKIGRKPIEIPENFADLIGKWEQGDISLNFVLEATGMKKSTFYRRLSEHRKKALSEGL